MAEPNLYTSDSLYQPHILQPSIPQPQQVSVRYQEAPKLYATDALFTKELVGPPKPPTQEEMQSYISQRDKELTSYDANIYSTSQIHTSCSCRSKGSKLSRGKK